MEISLKEHAGGRTRKPRQTDQQAAPKSKSPGCVNTRGWGELEMTEPRGKKAEKPDPDGIKPGSSK
jgi:hypothetical protein